MTILRLVAIAVAMLFATPASAQVAPGGVWVVTVDNQVYRLVPGFERMPGRVKQVSIGTDGKVWGLDLDGNLVSWTGTGWDPGIPAKFKQISVRNSQEVWGVNAANEVYRSNASSTGWTWERMGQFQYVSVGGDGTVWAINASGEPFRRDGSAWTAMPTVARFGFLERLTVTDAQHVVGMVNSGEYLQWTGTGWQVLDCPGCLDAVLAADGSVWGLYSQLVRNVKAVSGVFHGTQWEPPVTESISPFAQFAVGPAGPPTPPPATSGGSGMTSAQEQAVLQAHNTERQQLAGFGVQPLRWSPELAALARDWAQQQVVKPRPPSHRSSTQLRALNPLAPGAQLGENMAWGWPVDEPELGVPASYVTDMWIAEKQYYHHNQYDTGSPETQRGWAVPPGCTAPPPPNGPGTCGHYTQVVWKTTQYVGCGMAVVDSSKEAMFVCNYYPLGNALGYKPY